MGEELELGTLFIMDKNGKSVPFEGIKTSDIIDCSHSIGANDQWYDLGDLLIPSGTIEFDMTIKCHRKATKIFKAQINRYRRWKRHEKRMKELDRRRRLKGVK